jgi:uncharacterized protein (DUF433 family)
MAIREIIKHIRLDDGGVAWIDDTRVKVIGVAMDHLVHGWSAEEIHRQHPDFSLAQVLAASAAVSEEPRTGSIDSPGRHWLPMSNVRTA